MILENFPKFGKNGLGTTKLQLCQLGKSTSLVHWQPHLTKQSFMAAVEVGQDAMLGRLIKVLLPGFNKFEHVSIFPALALQT